LSAGTSRELLGMRDFRLLFAARTISFLGTNLAPIAVAFAVLDLDGSKSQVGLAFAAWTLAQISTSASAWAWACCSSAGTRESGS
jgi:hypothetical protein